MDDTLSSVLDESGDEEEQDAVVNQVLDEIGIEISGKVRACFIIYVAKLIHLDVKNYEIFHYEDFLFNNYYYNV